MRIVNSDRHLANNAVHRCITTAWKALGRDPGLPKQAALSALVSLEHGNFQPEDNTATAGDFVIDFDDLMTTSLRKSSRFFHTLSSSELPMFKTWGDDSGRHRRTETYDQLPPDHQINITGILLAASIPNNLGITVALTQARLPEITSQKYDYRNHLHATINSSIEDAWKNRLLGKNDSLNWNGTVESVLHTLEEFTTQSQVKDPTIVELCQNEQYFTKLCGLLHNEMVRRNQWRDDTKLYRDSDSGNPMDYGRLPPDMKENYVIIMLAALGGISDYVSRENPRRPTSLPSAALSRAPQTDLLLT